MAEHAGLPETMIQAASDAIVANLHSSSAHGVAEAALEAAGIPALRAERDALEAALRQAYTAMERSTPSRPDVAWHTQTMRDTLALLDRLTAERNLHP